MCGTFLRRCGGHEEGSPVIYAGLVPIYHNHPCRLIGCVDRVG